MEAEYSALSRDLLPFRELLIALSPSITQNGRHSATFRTTVHEDNSGAWSLANLEPGRLTPRSKQYAMKLHWFRSTLISSGPHPIQVVQISHATSGYSHQGTHKNQVPSKSEIALWLVNQLTFLSSFFFLFCFSLCDEPSEIALERECRGTIRNIMLTRNNSRCDCICHWI
jgi:hypothetical protein